MRSGKFVSTTIALLAAQLLFVPPSLGQDVGDLDALQEVIDQQQRRLNEQEAELARQKLLVEELLERVESGRSGGDSTGVVTTEEGASDTVSGNPPEEPHPGFEGLGQSIEAAQETWPGSFRVRGSDTLFRLSGFTELDFMHDTDAIQTPAGFVTAAIDTSDATAAEKGYSQTNASIQSSRLVLETRTPLHDHRLTTFVAVDFLTDLTTTAPQLHVRQIYGEVNDILFGGDLRFGHDWSTFTNVDTIPNVLDAQAQNALFATRHPVVRWTRPLRDGLKLLLAAEATDVHLIEGATAAPRWPDAVGALVWAGDTFLLQGSVVARDLRATDTVGNVEGTFGWGANVSGRLHLPVAQMQDFVSFSLTYGDGIGGVLNDTPPDAVYDPERGRLVSIPTLGWFAGYQHWWDPRFYSVVSYGSVEQDTLSFQGPTAYSKTQYASVNLSWTPVDQWLFGIEVLYGTREDNDGAKGSNYRGLLVTRFNF